MNQTNKAKSKELLREQENGIEARQQNLAFKWWRALQRHRRMRDPMLVFNMSIFNFDDGWNRIFNPLKIHERGTR